MKYHTSKIMKMAGNVQSIPYSVIYRRGVKMITLRTDRQGNIHVSAPYFVSRREIESLIIRNKEKLLAKLPERKLWRDGAEVVLQGKPVRISSSAGETRLEGDVLFVSGSSADEIQEQVKELYRLEVRRRVTPMVETWCTVLGIRVGRISIRDSHRVWASCSRSGNLNFSLRCAGLDDDDLSYLVLHELAHRVHFNHGSLFHAYLDEHMPSWREKEKHLRVMQRSCDVFGG
jgi:predicted metal-dependent hydrolase